MSPPNRRQVLACGEEHFLFTECNNCNTVTANFQWCVVRSQEFCMETDLGSEHEVSFNIPYLYKLKMPDFKKIVHLTLQSPVVPPCLTLSNSTFYPHSVFMCFVWISEQTAIISLYSINWLVCITETGVCLLRSTDCVYVFCVDLRTNSDYFTVQH
jgi:hypothetical protein